MRYVLIILLFSSWAGALRAQELQGIIYELGSDKVLAEVDITNLSKQQTKRSNSLGYFSIPVSKEDLLVFSFPGYRKDTLVVTEISLKRVYLTPLDASTMLDEIQITEMSNTQLDEAIAEAAEKSKSAGADGAGLWLSPSRIFGKEANDARKLRKFLVEEKKSRTVLARFTPVLVQSITPLEGRELDLFMVKYKPSYTFIQQADDQSLRLYIMDAYREFKSLSQEEVDRLKLVK